MIEIETSAAQHSHRPPSNCELADLRERSAARTASSSRQSGSPVRRQHGKKATTAMTFEQLRAAALELAKEGIHVSRFKGLGEMNWDSQPGRRRWIPPVSPADPCGGRGCILDADTTCSRRSWVTQVEPRREVHREERA